MVPPGSETGHLSDPWDSWLKEMQPDVCHITRIFRNVFPGAGSAANGNSIAGRRGRGSGSERDVFGADDGPCRWRADGVYRGTGLAGGEYRTAADWRERKRVGNQTGKRRSLGSSMSFGAVQPMSSFFFLSATRAWRLDPSRVCLSVSFKSLKRSILSQLSVLFTYCLELI